MGWLSIMRVESIKTHKIEEDDVISKILDQYIKTVEEEDIIVITSKIISIVQGRLVAKNTISKHSLVYKEADLVLETDATSSSSFR